MPHIAQNTRRPPRRFNNINERLKSKNYNAETRRANRAYLQRYTRKRGNAVSRSALVQERHERALKLLESFPPASPASAAAVKPKRAPRKLKFIQVDVGGDGNCFYRALYRVAHDSKDPTMLKRVFTILGADTGKMGTEEMGQTALRAAAARLIAEKVEDPEGIYERLKGAAEMPKAEQLFFKMMVDEAAYGVAPIYRRIKSYTRRKNGKDAFYKNLSRVVGRNGEYASEADYYMIRDLLEAKGILLISTDSAPTSNVVGGKPALYLRRIHGNHYNYWKQV
jgi:hypothetical protein